MNDNDTQSGFYLLSDNTDAFVARFALATMATKTLDIQYYIMHNDASGQYLGYAILAAADRGVHVRILVDDINLTGRDNSLKMLSQHKNIEICIFNPLSNRNWFRNLELITNLDRAGRRMHNKLFVADNYAAIVGGRNIGDEYFDARKSLNFVDLDLLTIGPIVDDITRSFSDYWESHWSTSIESLNKTTVFKKQLYHIRRRLKDKWHRAKNTQYFKSLRQSDLAKKIINKQIPFIWADAKLFYDLPEKLCTNTAKKTIHFGPEAMSYFEEVKKELLIASPYFVPGNSGADWLISKKKKGTKIKVLTNSLAATDVIAVHAGYKKYRHRLVKAGINLFELKPTAQHFHEKTKGFMKGISNSSLHAKYMIIDQQYVFIGSANIDPRSRNLNTEIGIMVNSKELAVLTSHLFNKTISSDNSYQLSINPSNKKLTWSAKENMQDLSFTKEPSAGIIRRIGVFILGLFPIENLL
jgi:putative cardiolipin synthase